MSRSQPRRFMRNGRLTSSAFILSLDRTRCFWVALSVLLLALTHPGNYSLSTRSNLTNYFFFSVQDRIDALRFYAVNLQYDCPTATRMEHHASFEQYPPDDLEFLGRHMCVQLRNLLAHERPLLYDPTDHAHTVHRILTATIVLLALLQWCCTTTSLSFGSLWKDSFVSIIWPTHGLVWSLWNANVYLYPVWKAMSHTAGSQRVGSWFRVVNDPGTNVMLSALFLLGLTVLVNAASMYYTGSFQLRGLEGLMATGWGYYRAVYKGSSSPSLQWWRSALLLNQADWIPNINAISLTWFLLLQAISRGSLLGGVAFFVANLTGFVMGDYQKTNMSVSATFERMWQNTANSIASLFAW